MKKKIAMVLAGAMLVAGMLTGCGNKQVIDTTRKFDRAVIMMPDGEIVDCKVDSWTNFEDGDQIQVKSGKYTYLVHSSNVVLVAGVEG